MPHWQAGFSAGFFFPSIVRFSSRRFLCRSSRSCCNFRILSSSSFCVSIYGGDDAILGYSVLQGTNVGRLLVPFSRRGFYPPRQLLFILLRLLPQRFVL